MIDMEDERTFTQAQLDAMKPIRKGTTIAGFILGDGSELVVDTLDGRRVWVQHDRKNNIYRCADKKSGEATPFETRWRRPLASR
jgi:hypothetical protein